MATCSRCGTIMPATPGAKCPACGVVSIPGPGAQAIDSALERMKSAARRIDTAARTPTPGKRDPPRMTALGLALAILGVAAFVAAWIAALVGIQWQAGPAAELAALLNGLSLLLVVGGVVLIGNGLGFGFVPTALTAVSMFIPLVNVIVLFLVCARAVAALTRAGWRVGVPGARRPTR